MKLLATHVTRYWYSEPVSMCHTQTHLMPRACPNQAVLEYEFKVSPQPGSMTSHKDYFGNEVTLFSVAEPHQELIITSRCLAELAPPPVPDLDQSPPWEQVRAKMFEPSSPEAFEAGQFSFESPLIVVGEPFASYAASSFPSKRPFLRGVNDLSRRIFTEFRYDQRATTVTTPVDEVFGSRRGVCQDFAHLMIACLRSLSLPARYISGYVRTGANFAGAEASHAWVSVWCPVLGWRDFDPTNNAMTKDEHVTLAWGRDYSDVAPVKGVALGGGGQVISVSVDVSRKNGDDSRPE